MPNRLREETSPYLRQHADNPVDWYPWNEEALERARREDKPILLSIGYAACHWCHVMAHESFEDLTTAAFMNEHFVNIKVDREERPDLDHIYMNAVVALTGQGGWPMTVALTPDGAPFFGGTYFPPVPRHGLPSFKQVLASLVRAWQERRQDIAENAEQIAAHLAEAASGGGRAGEITPELIGRAVTGLKSSFDGRYGGFGGAPKFPQPMTIEFLLRFHLSTGDPEALAMAEHTLVMMAEGGIYDQLGGGFARYATDEQWLVPHFEKMLYDNALLSRVYVHAWMVTGRPLYRRVAEETLDWVLAEMRDPAGGFYSSLDADSEGEEGRFYVWDAEEIRRTAGEDAAAFEAYYGVTGGGNWEGRNILHVARSLDEAAELAGLEPEVARKQIDRARDALRDARAERVRPGLDHKVLTAWNGLMIAAFADAGRYLGRADYVNAAVANATFLRQTMSHADGRLLRTWTQGEDAHLNAYLEDYAYLAEGLLALYEATYYEQWYVWARQLNERIVRRFWDDNEGGFFDTSDDHEKLLHRPRDVQDNATPSGNAMAALVMLRLSLYEGDGALWDRASQMVASMVEPMARYPTGFAQWLAAAALMIGDPKEVAIAGDLAAGPTQSLLAALNGSYRPTVVSAAGVGETAVPLLRDRSPVDGRPAAYVCQRFVCQRPVTDPAELERQLAS